MPEHSTLSLKPFKNHIKPIRNAKLNKSMNNLDKVNKKHDFLRK